MTFPGFGFQRGQTFRPYSPCYMEPAMSKRLLPSLPDIAAPDAEPYPAYCACYSTALWLSGFIMGCGCALYLGHTMGLRARLSERPGCSTDQPIEFPHDLSGLSIKTPRVRVVHTDRRQPGRRLDVPATSRSVARLHVGQEPHAAQFPRPRRRLRRRRQDRRLCSWPTASPR